VIIVDEFTGRTMVGRRWSDACIRRSRPKKGQGPAGAETIATITVQNYFRQYEKLAGMTGTALTEAEEFHKIYKLDVVAIPTHSQHGSHRQPGCDLQVREVEVRGVIEEIVEMNKQTRPGAGRHGSVEKSERLARMLERRGVSTTYSTPSSTNARLRSCRGPAKAGRCHHRNNMAGRGTDIVLDSA